MLAEPLTMDAPTRAYRGDELTYHYQVVERQGTEVGLEVALTQKFESKGDAIFMRDKIRAERDYGLNPFGFYIAIKVTIADEEV